MIFICPNYDLVIAYFNQVPSKIVADNINIFLIILEK